MRFDGCAADIRIVFGGKDDTVNSETQPFGEVKVMPGSVVPGVFN
jgi:hypothetical protein